MYNYTTGDGPSVLLPTEPDGATEPVSNLDDAIRQIKAYLNDTAAMAAALVGELLTPGFQMAYGGSSAPAGWLECDGSAVSRTTYAALFAVIGTTYGVGDGSTTFNLPDKRGRGSIGKGTGSGLTARSQGAQIGAESVALAQAELPNYNLSVNLTRGLDDNTTGDYFQFSTNTGSGSRTLTIASGGSGTAHANMQPSEVDMWLIKT